MIGAREHQALFDRLEQLIALFPSRTAFARAVGIDASTISDWKARLRQPRALSLMKVCAALEVDANWLLLGHGVPGATHFSVARWQRHLDALQAFKRSLSAFEETLRNEEGSADV